MREIKFRAWDKNDKRIFIDPQMIDFYNKKIGYMQYQTEYMPDTSYSIPVGFEEFEYSELMQYTGMKDVTEKEIYEGDVVKLVHTGIEISADRLEDLKRFVGIIKYENGIFKIVRTEKSLIESKYFEMEQKKVSEIFIYSKLYDLEVIGNIFENKELLEIKNG